MKNRCICGNEIEKCPYEFYFARTNETNGMERDICQNNCLDYKPKHEGIFISEEGNKVFGDDTCKFWEEAWELILSWIRRPLQKFYGI